MIEKVDTLLPPFFEKSGIIKTRDEAISDGDWIGVFNLWIIQTEPTPAIIYQQRAPTKSWAPLAFDVSVAGHLIAGETGTQGLREAEEELGVTYEPTDLISVGRKLHVDKEHSVIDIYMVVDNSPLDTFVLQKEEVYAISRCSLEQLIDLHSGRIHSFTAPIRYADGSENCSVISTALIPQNWDQYHYKMALLAQKYVNGEFPLIY